MLIGMLSSAHDEDVAASVRSLQLLTSLDTTFCTAILSAGGIEKLTEIVRRFAASLYVPEAKPVDKMPTMARSRLTVPAKPAAPPPMEITPARKQTTLDCLSVLCNMTDELEVKRALRGVADIDTTLLRIAEHSANADMQSRVAILLGDLASLDDATRVSLAERGALPHLIALTDSEQEDLLVNAVNALEIMCRENAANQRTCAEARLLERFVALVRLDSDMLRASVAACVAVLVRNNPSNQAHTLRAGLIAPLVDLLK